MLQEHKADMSEERTEPQGDLVSVFLTCIVCGSVQEIHIAPDPDIGKKAYWECLECQAEGGRTYRDPSYHGRLRRGT